MQFGILGPLDVRSADGEPIPVGGPRPRAVLVMLLMNAGHVVSVDQLIDGQYGDDPPGGAANAVQAQVSRLRRNLPGMIEFTSAGYRLAVDQDDVDLHRFERLAREGHRLLSAGNHGPAAALLREALGLWRGTPLADLPFGEAQVARLEELRLSAAEDLVEAELSLPEGTSVAELQRLAAAHPLRERLTGQLMRALHAAGRQSEALSAYEETRRLLADELGADPSPELAEIHLAILRAEQPRQQRLAAQLTSFVGRGRELERLTELRGARLVTIIGPGGTGKTRLAVEAGARVRHEVGLVDLAPLDGGEQVPRAVLRALGIRESGLQSFTAPDPVELLTSALAGRELLLILDNCEHVITAAATLARRLLGECPGLSILATSREPLGLTGETLLPLAPLETPSAVQLFLDRAAAVRPGFAMRPEVAEICIALDGLPLAIELAAARLRTFTVEELATRLAEHGRFRLLSRGDRTAAARHQTLHAVVEWSWDLLTPDEQLLAARFSVFAGSASLEAVEAICGDLPDGLVDKSLIVAEGARFRMPETIRLFCAEKLSEDVQPAHARYFLDLAQRADPHLRRAEQLDWLARLSADRDNLNAALRWAVQHDRETGQRLVAALGAYWWLSGRPGEAGEAAAQLLEPLAGLEEEYAMCVVHAVPRAGPEHWERAEAVMRGMDRPLRHPFSAALWGMAAGPPGAGGPDANHRLLVGDPWNQALIRLSQALMTLLGGVPTEAERELGEILGQFRALGERWGIAQGLDGLAVIAGWRGEWARAGELWVQALGHLEELGALEEMADVLVRRAEALVRQGDTGAASADYRRAADLLRKVGRTDALAPTQLGLGEIARFEGDLERSGELLASALAATESGGFSAESNRARVLTALGRLAEASGNAEQARLRHREALVAARKAHVTQDLADAAEGQAGAALLDGAGARAALLLGAAVAMRGTAVTGDRDVARVAAGATALVGAEAFAASYAKGAAMTREQALTELSADWR